MKTFIKYSGNKSQHLRHLLPYVPKHYNTYIEPFLGSGALFLKLQPKKWIINDINQDLMNMWFHIGHSVEDIIKGLKLFKTKNKFTFLSSKDKLTICRKYAKKLTQLDPSSLNRAIYYIICKSCSYMGHIYVNNEFKIQSLDLKMIVNPSHVYFLTEKYFELLRKVSAFLTMNNNGHIMNQDYKKVLKNARKGDFCFLDVPYLEEKKYVFNYNIEENSQKFIDDVYKEVKKLDRRGISWIMTQSDTPEVKNKYKDYKIIEFPVYRYSTKSYKKELIIHNN